MCDSAQCAHKTDEELVKDTLGSKGFYACLVDRYEKKLKRYVARFVGLGNESANDILQNIFIKAYINLNDFDQSLKFSSWVYRIAHNEAVSYLRANRKKITGVYFEDGEGNVSERLADEFDLQADAEKQLLSQKISKVLDAMDGKYREIIILRVLEQKEYAEISDILKIPMGTVATLISRAKKNFRCAAQRENIRF